VVLVLGVGLVGVGGVEVIGGGVVDGVVVVATGAVVVAGGLVVGAFVAGLVVDALVDGAVVDGATVLTLVLVAEAVADVVPRDAVAGDTAWLADPDGPPPWLVSAGASPPEFSIRAITTAATPHAATPAPPAIMRRRVDGDWETRSGKSPS
jgi:hypothetical protein